MGYTALVGLDIAAGEQVVAALEKAGIPISVGLWAVFPEFEEGRVVLASPALDAMEPRAAYHVVAQVLHDNPPKVRPSLTILRMDDPFIQELRAVFASTSSTAGMRLGGQHLGNRFLDDAYVYKIQ